MKKKCFIMICMGLTLLGLNGCSSSKVLTKSELAMDTVCTVTIYDKAEDSVLDEVFSLIHSWDEKLDAFSETSVIADINAKAGIEPVIVEGEIYNLITNSLLYSELSDGGFDISSGPLIDLWGIGEPETKEAPAKKRIDAVLSQVGYQKIQFDPENRTVFLKQKGMKLNLGATAKGFVAEKVKLLLVEKGIQHAVINLGGSVTMIGGKTDQQDFTVGVTDPDQPEDKNIGILNLKDTSAVTSGDYQRYFTDTAGHRWHHILDCRTGYPTDNDLRQVTVVCSDTVQADALSTTLFIMGGEQAKAFLDRDDETEGILVFKDGSIYVSKGLEKCWQAQ